MKSTDTISIHHPPLLKPYVMVIMQLEHGNTEVNISLPLGRANHRRGKQSQYSSIWHASELSTACTRWEKIPLTQAWGCRKTGFSGESTQLCLEGWIRYGHLMKQCHSSYRFREEAREESDNQEFHTNFQCLQWTSGCEWENAKWWGGWKIRQDSFHGAGEWLREHILVSFLLS